MKSLFTPAPFFLLRTPMWPVEMYEDILKQSPLSLYDSDELLREAIFVASPSLSEALSKRPLKDPQQAIASLLNYAVRMATRATPFGLFSFVALGYFDQKTCVYFDHDQIYKRNRPEMEWTSFSDEVRANPLASAHGDRYLLSYIRNEKNGQNTYSIHANPLVRGILTSAKEPIKIEALFDKLRISLPSLDQQKMQGVVRDLLLHQFLLPIEPLSPTLGDNKTVDCAYRGVPPRLSKTVAEEVGRATSFLWEISASKTNSLRSYHTKFLEKYGTSRTVPLLELLSEENFIGVEEESSDTKKWLYRAWEETLFEKKQEIVLDETILSQPLDPYTAPTSLDVYCKVLADTQEEIDKGNFSILLFQTAPQGASTLGRFLDLFDHEEVRKFIQEEEKLEPHCIFVETSYLPASIRSANIAIHPCLRTYRLDLEAKKFDEHSLSLEDIYVGATSERFYLTLKSGAVEIEARFGNLLNPTLAPVPLQFMRAVSMAKYNVLYPFSWGKLEEHATFLPRVRYRKTILSPAKWNLNDRSFTSSPQFIAWADHWGLGKRFYLVHGDQHLLLDRTHPAHLELIIRKLKKGTSLQFVEHHEHAWTKSGMGNHSSEVVISFLRNSEYISEKRLLIPAYKDIAFNDRWKLPGSEWLYIKFYLAKEGENRFLLQKLMPLLGENHRWFFVRYADPEPHIRLRIKAPESVQFLLLKAAAQWMEERIIKNFVLTGYEREIERYGGVELMEAVEEVFCADSVATLQLLQSNLKEFDNAAIEFQKLAQHLPSAIYRDMLHMHCNRLGCTKEAEMRVITNCR